jgi:hypothetical protein
MSLRNRYYTLKKKKKPLGKKIEPDLDTLHVDNLFENGKSLPRPLELIFNELAEMGMRDKKTLAPSPQP